MYILIHINYVQTLISLTGSTQGVILALGARRAGRVGRVPPRRVRRKALPFGIAVAGTGSVAPEMVVGNSDGRDFIWEVSEVWWVPQTGMVYERKTLNMDDLGILH